MSISVPYEIPFHDVDSLGIVWHGHHYKYFELARTALYRSMHFDVSEMQQLGYSFPVIESQCRYSGALTYGQQVTLSAQLREYDYYILIEYRISDTASGARATYGHTKQAVCDLSGQLQPGVPDAVRDVLTQHVTTSRNEID